MVKQGVHANDASFPEAYKVRTLSLASFLFLNCRQGHLRPYLPAIIIDVLAQALSTARNQDLIRKLNLVLMHAFWNDAPAVLRILDENKQNYLLWSAAKVAEQYANYDADEDDPEAEYSIRYVFFLFFSSLSVVHAFMYMCACIQLRR
jgi:hypothetical protein